jgi:hypothetical protein
MSFPAYLRLVAGPRLGATLRTADLRLAGVVGLRADDIPVEVAFILFLVDATVLRIPAFAPGESVLFLPPPPTALRVALLPTLRALLAVRTERRATFL